MSKQVTLENTLAGGFGLPTGQIVPGNGSIVVEPEVWDAAKDHPVVAARVAAGTIIVDGKGKKAPASAGDIGALQARIAELEGQIRAKDKEIADLKSPVPKAPFQAKQKSPGWFAIYDADGKEVGKAFREDDAKAFNALDDAAKQKAVDEAASA